MPPQFLLPPAFSLRQRRQRLVLFDSIRLRAERKFGGVTAAAGSGVFPEAAWHTDRQSAVCHMAPFTPIPNRGMSWSISFLLLQN